MLSYKGNKVVIYIVFILFSSCINKGKDQRVYKDSLIYTLQDKASDKFEILICDFKPDYVYLTSNSDENRFSFVFFLSTINDEKMASYFSNRYIKSKSHIYKVLLDEDLLFFKQIQNNRLVEYPRAGITINSNGDLVDFFSEQYKISTPRPSEAVNNQSKNE